MFFVPPHRGLASETGGTIGPLAAPYFLDGIQGEPLLPRMGEDYFYVIASSEFPESNISSPYLDEITATPLGMELSD